MIICGGALRIPVWICRLRRLQTGSAGISPVKIDLPSH
ncbi:conserved hypothetical protein [delta proteobacterium NaphS2]|nr:conserved hypothetical protein [delta proteobacterium NaphS2]